MVRGLELFREYFAGYSDSYVLIGGAACDVLLEHTALPFRATRDLDIVLCVEAVTLEFGQAFWRFVIDGAYQIQESSNSKILYRFRKPASREYPEMLELFSRRPDAFDINIESRLTPIPIDDEVSSLSAILLDRDYYDFIQTHKIKIDELSLVSIEALVALKAKAWLDLEKRRSCGEAVDSRNIKKHKNDICRLFAALTPEMRVETPRSIRTDIANFLDRLQSEPVDTKSLNLPFPVSEVIRGLRKLFF